MSEKPEDRPEPPPPPEDADPVARFLARRTSGEVVLLALFAGVMLFAAGVYVGGAIGSL
ncbi:MAG: hypothetical protein GW855_06445 [Erythrobacter sp.]|nr:hypothetical protein [Erythrobacter sp.]NCQ64209.1 hypothetical protein [Alphaproteobacteria bacterium]